MDKNKTKAMRSSKKLEVGKKTLKDLRVQDQGLRVKGGAAALVKKHIANIKF